MIVFSIAFLVASLAAVCWALDRLDIGLTAQDKRNRETLKKLRCSTVAARCGNKSANGTPNGTSK